MKQSYMRTACILFASTLTIVASPITVLNNSMGLPENISRAPAGFGSYGGQYFVDDTGKGGDGPSVIWAVQPSGPNAGQASVFNSAAFTQSLTRGSTFLPPDFGRFGNDFVVAATNAQYCASGVCGFTTGTSLLAFDANGNASTLYSDTLNLQSRFPVLGGPLIAPVGFGNYGGTLIVLDQPTVGCQPCGGGTVLSIKPDGSATTVANLPLGQFTLSDTFTPANWGQFGNMLLVGDLYSGSIFAVDASGNAKLFTNVPLNIKGQFGLRQMAIAPAGFGTFGNFLFVSVAGSNYGGGAGGSVDVIDTSGKLVAVLQQGTVGAPFDPRGLYFADANTLLVNDADPGILIATPQAFTPVTAAIPEPGTIGMLATGLTALVLVRKRRQRAAC